MVGNTVKSAESDLNAFGFCLFQNWVKTAFFAIFWLFTSLCGNKNFLEFHIAPFSKASRCGKSILEFKFINFDINPK